MPGEPWPTGSVAGSAARRRLPFLPGRRQWKASSAAAGAGLPAACGALGVQNAWLLTAAAGAPCHDFSEAAQCTHAWEGPMKDAHMHRHPCRCALKAA